MSVTSPHTLDEGLWHSCWELIEGGGWQCSSAYGGACKGDQHVWPAVAQFEALSVISLLKLYAFLDYFYQSGCREINVVCMDQTLKVPILHHHRFRGVSNSLILHSSCLKSFCCCIICFSFYPSPIGMPWPELTYGVKVVRKTLAEVDVEARLDDKRTLFMWVTTISFYSLHFLSLSCHL